MRNGCRAGSKADKPFEYSWGTFDRCPLAILRDASQAEIGAINWAIEMAVSKKQGSLPAYIPAGTFSARGDTLISIAEETMAARDQEALDRIAEDKPPTGKATRKVNQTRNRKGAK